MDVWLMAMLQILDNPVLLANTAPISARKTQNLDAAQEAAGGGCC
jgi:hypothetical protein